MTGSQVARANPLSDFFWMYFDEIRYIRQAARARMVSPEAVLIALLARLSAMLLPGTVIETGIGTPTPLHTNAALIGGSSAGKTAAVGIAADLLPWPEHLVHFDGPLGSGEGLIENMLGYDEHGKRVQLIHNLLVTIDEGQVLNDTARRSGSIIMPTLRSLWSGGQVGQANASKDTRRIVDGGTYSYGVILLLQPALAGALLADVAGGTPQRFLFASAWDQDAPDTPPPWPPQWCLPGPLPVLTKPITFEVDPDILEDLRIDRLLGVRGVTAVHPLDGHLNLVQLRVAALLAILTSFGYEHVSLNLSHWGLADILIRYSTDIRDLLIEDLASYEAAEDHQLGMRAGRKAVASDQAYVRSVAERIAEIRASRHPKGYAWTNMEVFKRLGRKQREYFEAATALLEEPHAS